MPRTDRSRGWVKGQPRRFIHGHGWTARKPRPKRYRLVVVKVRARKPWPRCECGCGQPAKSRYCRFAEGHRLPLKVVRHEVDPATGCWNWLLAVDIHGYPKATRRGGRIAVHRTAYEDAYGSIPDGHVVHHRCGNKLCVNPEHLQALTNEEHSRLHGRVWRKAA